MTGAYNFYKHNTFMILMHVTVYRNPIMLAYNTFNVLILLTILSLYAHMNKY